jgi:hypothetical protein
MASLSADRFEIVGLWHLVQERERSQQEPVHAKRVEPADIEFQQRIALAAVEIVAVGEFLRISFCSA